MSSVAYGNASPAGDAPKRGLPARAGAYLAAVAALSVVAATLPALSTGAPTREDWLTLLVLVLGGAIAHAFATHVPGNQIFHTGLAFVVAGALLLPPQLLLVACVAPHAVDWIRQRYAWYVQTFNICNYVLSALAAYAAAVLVAGLLDVPAVSPRTGIAAAVTFVAVNHVLLAAMLVLARGQNVRETKLFSIDGAMPDAVLALLGAGAAMALELEPWALPIVLSPLVLIHRALAVPGLLEQARTDPKTGLFNYRHFTARLDEELTRAQRFGRPLSVLVADLDLLREINNVHGHLAGDAVLAGVADVFREELRPYDVPARFGGEEFAILLPETRGETAHAIAERIGAAVAARDYVPRPGAAPIRATISIGLASFPEHALEPQELVRRADTALYQAKRGGRDRVVSADAHAAAA
jgi:diguanylate cyclase (GGDEF)-like protein